MTDTLCCPRPADRDYHGMVKRAVPHRRSLRGQVAVIAAALSAGGGRRTMATARSGRYPPLLAWRHIARALRLGDVRPRIFVDGVPGPLDVRGERRDRSAGIAGKSCVHDRRVFAGQVARREGKRPAPVELGLIRQGAGDVLHPAASAAAEDDGVKFGVRVNPVVGKKPRLIRGHGGVRETVMGGHYLRLPGHVSVFDRPAQGRALDREPHLHEIGEVLEGEVSDGEADLRYGPDQLLTGKPVECLADDVEADAVLGGQVRDLEPLARLEPAREDRRANLLVNAGAQGVSVPSGRHEP
jgi:hypothetical protein